MCVLILPFSHYLCISLSLLSHSNPLGSWLHPPTINREQLHVLWELLDNQITFLWFGLHLYLRVQFCLLRPLSLIGFDSLLCSATTELLMYAQGKQKTKVAMRDDTNINVENPQWWEKPRQPIDCWMHYDEEITKRWEHKGNDLLCLLFLRHTRRLQRGGNYLSLSLTLCTTNSIQE